MAINRNFDEQSLVPDVFGGLYIGEAQSVAGLNKPFRAQILSTSDGVHYSWIEVQQMPGTTQLLGGAGQNFTAVPGGSGGMETTDPIVEENGLAIPLGAIVWAQRSYFDVSYNWIFTCDASSACSCPSPGPGPGPNPGNGGGPGSGGTGSGFPSPIPGPTDCPAVSFATESVECENGLLIQYIEIISLYFIGNCLKASHTDRTKVGQIGCCDCAGFSGSGSGTGGTGGKGSGLPNPCVPATCIYCNDPPYQWEVIVESFRGNCNPFNGDWILLPSVTGCTWIAVDNFAGFTVVVTLTMTSLTTATLDFSYSQGGVVIASSSYSFTLPGIASGDCCEPFLFNTPICVCDDSTSDLTGNYCTNCTLTPNSWKVTVTGMTGQFAVFNNVWEMDFINEVNVCFWLVSGLTNLGVSMGMAGGTPADAVFVLQFLDTNTGAQATYYSGTVGGDCCQLYTMTLALQNGVGMPAPSLTIIPSCSDQSSSPNCPATISAIPFCCHGGASGSGSGSGAGSGSGSGAGSSSGSGSISTGCCPGVALNSSLKVVFSGGTGTCSCLNNISVQVTNPSGGTQWVGSYNCPLCPTIHSSAVTLSCIPLGGGHFTWHLQGQNFSTNATSVSCAPVDIVFSNFSIPNGVCAGNITATVLPWP